MARLLSMPNLAQLVQPFLLRNYKPHECWRLVIDLLDAGGLLQANVEPAHVLSLVQEVWWWQGDTRDPLSLSQPWDWWLVRKGGPAVSHIALVVDSLSLVHVGTAGVALEPLRRWRTRLVQIARLRTLL